MPDKVKMNIDVSKMNDDDKETVIQYLERLGFAEDLDFSLDYGRGYIMNPTKEAESLIHKHGGVCY